MADQSQSAGWYYHPHPYSDPFYQLEYFDGTQWTGRILKEYGFESDAQAFAPFQDLVNELGPTFGEIVEDAEAICAYEHDSERAEAAGYSLVEERREAAFLAATRLNERGAGLRAERGEAYVTELKKALDCLLLHEVFRKAEELLDGGEWWTP